MRFSDEVFNQDSIDRLNKEADKITNNITVDESKDDKTVTSNELADIMFALSSSRNTKVCNYELSSSSYFFLFFLLYIMLSMIVYH